MDSYILGNVAVGVLRCVMYIAKYYLSSFAINDFAYINPPSLSCKYVKSSTRDIVAMGANLVKNEFSDNTFD